MALQIGQIEDGYKYLGGDPSNEKNWTSVDVKLGQVEDGYKYTGGDPGKETSWIKVTEPVDMSGPSPLDAALKPYMPEGVKPVLTPASSPQEAVRRVSPLGELFAPTPQRIADTRTSPFSEEYAAALFARYNLSSPEDRAKLEAEQTPEGDLYRTIASQYAEAESKGPLGKNDMRIEKRTAWWKGQGATPKDAGLAAKRDIMSGVDNPLDQPSITDTEKEKARELTRLGYDPKYIAEHPYQASLMSGVAGVKSGFYGQMQALAENPTVLAEMFLPTIGTVLSSQEAARKRNGIVIVNEEDPSGFASHLRDIARDFDRRAKALATDELKADLFEKDVPFDVKVDRLVHKTIANVPSITASAVALAATRGFGGSQLAARSGTAVLVALSATEGGAKYHEMREQGFDKDTAMKANLAYGAISFLSEKYELNIANRVISRFDALSTAEKANIGTQIMHKVGVATGIPLTEGAGEGLTEYGHNLTDKITGRLDSSAPTSVREIYESTPITQGVAEAATIGAIGGTMFAPLGVMQIEKPNKDALLASQLGVTPQQINAAIAANFPAPGETAHGAPLQSTAPTVQPTLQPAPASVRPTPEPVQPTVQPVAAPSPVDQILDPNVSVDQQIQDVQNQINNPAPSAEAVISQSLASLQDDDLLDIPDVGQVRVRKSDTAFSMELPDGTQLDDATIGGLLSNPSSYTVTERGGKVTEGGADVLQQRTDIRNAELAASSIAGQGTELLGGVGVSGTAPLSSGAEAGGAAAGVASGGGQAGPVRTESVADQAVADVERVAREEWAKTDAAAEIAAAEAAAIIGNNKAEQAGPAVSAQVASTLTKPLGTNDNVVVVPASEIVKFAVVTEGDKTPTRIAQDEKIRESIRTNGYDAAQPIEIVVDRNSGLATIKDGSHRAVIAAEMGISVPVVVRSAPIGRKRTSAVYNGELDVGTTTQAATRTGGNEVSPAANRVAPMANKLAPVDNVVATPEAVKNFYAGVASIGEFNPETRTLTANGVTVQFAEPTQGKVAIFDFKSDEPGQGKGTAVLDQVLAVADRHGVPMELSATPLTAEGVAVSDQAATARLRDYYASKGFEPRVGTSTFMDRAPSVTTAIPPVAVGTSAAGNVVLTPPVGVESFTPAQVDTIRTTFGGGIASGPADARVSVTLPKTVTLEQVNYAIQKQAAAESVLGAETAQPQVQVGLQEVAGGNAQGPAVGGQAQQVTLGPSPIPSIVMSNAREALANTGLNAGDIQFGMWQSLPETSPGIDRNTGKTLASVVKALTGRDVVFFSGPITHQGMFIAGPVSAANTLFVNANRTETNPLGTLGHEWLHSLRQAHPKIYARLRATVMGQNPDMIAMYRDYFGASIETSRMSDADIAAFLSDPKNANFLEEELMADLTGNRFKDVEFWNNFFADVAANEGKSRARMLADQILKMLRNLKAALKGEGFKADQFVSDIAEVEAAVKQAVQEYMLADRTMAAQAMPVAPQVGEVRASPGKGVIIGDFKGKEYKDGSLLILGDAKGIRNLIPKGVRGRVVEGGLRFTHSDAPRVQSALKGGLGHGGRGGVVTEKINYDAAPKKYNTPGKIGALRKQLMKLALEGERGRFWYENSSNAILRYVGGVIEKARKFAALLAIYSPQAKVDTNGTFAIRGWAQHEAGMPINVKTKVFDKKANDAMRDTDAFWSGEKTGNFVTNLLRNIDHHLKQGATIDMWMMRAAEYDTDAPTSNQYAFMENEINRIAQELGWEPQQVQAAIWVAMKARMENDSVKAKTEEISEKKGWITFHQDPKKGRVRHVHNLKAHRANWLKHALAHTPTEADTNRAAFDFGDALSRHIGQISWEAEPSRSVSTLAAIHNAPYELKVKFQAEIQKAFYDENGTDMLADFLGLLVGSRAILPGVWQGGISASSQVDVVMAPQMGGGAVDPAQAKLLNIYAAVVGLVTAQDGVGWHRPFYTTTKAKANGVNIDLGRPITSEEARDVESAIAEWMRDNDKATFVNDEGKVVPWDNAFAIISSPRGVRLLNFGVVSNQQLHKDVLAAVENVLPDYDHRAFMSDGDMPTNDWKELPNGQGYIQRISAEGRSDVLRWARDFLAPRIQAIARKFAEEHGLGNAEFPRFSPARGGPNAGRGGYNREGLGEGARPVYGSERKREHSLSVVGVHYSPAPRQTLSSRFYGTGLAGDEAVRLASSKDKRIRDRIYFYANAGKGIDPESGVGAYPHTVQLDNVYDLEADPLFLASRLPTGLSESDRHNTLESSVLDAGFDGYINKFGNGRAIVLLGQRDVDVRQEKVGEAVDVPLAPKSETNPYITSYEAFVKDRSVPMGQMTGAAWKRLLSRTRPDMDVSSLDDEKMYYRDGVASAAFKGMIPATGVNLSPARSGVWYSSPLADAMKAAPEKIFGPATQVKVWLQANAGKIGVKADEIQWSGINDWLDLQGKAKVTKADVLAYLDKGGVQVSETMLRDPADIEIVVKGSDANGYYIFDKLTGEDYPGDFDTEEEAMDEAERLMEGAATDAAKYGNWKLPGGKHYRELLLTLPDARDTVRNLQRKMDAIRKGRLPEEMPSDQRDQLDKLIAEYESARKKQDTQFRSGHFDQPNILAHVRFDDRTDVNGRKVLFIQEVQSDWGQEGRDTGFGRKPERSELAAVAAAERGFWYVYPKSRSEDAAPYIGRRIEANTAEHAIDLAHVFKIGRNEKGEFLGGQLTPEAPFVTDTKSWVALAIKRMISYAARNKYDAVAWTTGKQQAERYNLSKSFDRVQYSDGDYLEAFNTDGVRVVSMRVALDDLENVVGKDLAKQIISDAEQDNARRDAYYDAVKNDASREEIDRLSDLLGPPVRTYSGLDLSVGGEGMKTFYDQIVPQVTNDVLKKLGGGKVDQVVISDAALETELTSQPGFDITANLREKAAQGLPLFSPSRTSSDEDLAKKFADAVAQGDAAMGSQIEHALNEANDDWVAAKRGVVPHADTQSVADALARRIGMSVEDMQKILNGKPVEIDGRMAQPAEILAASMAVSRVNVANLLMAKDANDFADRMADVLNLMIATRAEYSEIARALSNLGWMERKGAMTIEDQVNERSDVMKADLRAKNAEGEAVNAQQEAEEELTKIDKKDGGATRLNIEAQDTIDVAEQLEADATEAEGEARKLKQGALKKRATGDVEDKVAATNDEAMADGILSQAKKLRKDASKLRAAAKAKLARAQKSLEKAKVKKQDADAWAADAKRAMDRARQLKAEATRLKGEAMKAREAARRLIGKANTDITKARLSAQKANSVAKKMRYAITKQRLVEALGGEKGMVELFAELQKQGNTISMDALVKMFQGIAGAQLRAIKRNEKNRGSKLHRTVDFINRSVLGSAAELFKAFILSKLGTHLLNISSTWLHRTLEMRVTKMIAEMLPEGAGAKQHLAVIHGLTGVTADAIAVANFARFGEYLHLQMIELIKMDPRRQKMVMELTKNKWLDQSERFLPGKFGRLVRNIGFTPLGMEDAFMKILPYRYSLAMQEASGRPIDYAEAVEYAELNTFQSHSDPIANLVSAAAAKFPVIGLFVPFTTTLSNLIVQGVRYTPGLGLVSAMNSQMALNEAREAGDAVKIRRAIDNRNQAIARSIVGGMTVMLYLLASAAGDDDEEPLISGMRPVNKDKFAIWRQENGALAIKIDDQIISFERFDPLATSWGLTVAMANAIKAESGGEAFIELGKGMYGMIFDKYFMQDVGELLVSLKRPESAGRQFSRYFANMLASMTVPGIVAQFPETFDPYQRDTTAGKDFWTMYEDMVKAKTPGLRTDLAPRLDVYGKPLENTAFRNPTPVRPQTMRPDPLNNWLLKLGRGLDAKPRSLDGLSSEVKQRLLAQRHDMLTELMNGTDGLTREEKRDLIRNELRSWTTDYVNDAREEAALSKASEPDTDKVD